MSWRAFIKPIFVVCYSLLICITLPFLILKLYEKSAPAIVSAWFVAGLFVLGAIPISLWTIIEHMINYTNPLLQRHIIRVFIDHCRHGALQYTVIRPLTTAIALICEMVGVYGEGDFNFRHAFLYLTIINNVSQIWALYCLVMFYRCTRLELSPMKPVAKFLCVKFVVFMSFWQSILIAVLAATGVIRKVEAWKLYDVQSIGIALQCYFMIEVFLKSHSVRHFHFSSDRQLSSRHSLSGTYHRVVSVDADEVDCNSITYCDNEINPLLSNQDSSSNVGIGSELLRVRNSGDNIQTEKIV
ncbi:unnamed protein product [Schistosoma margrebowiei]|uniref:Transmembrane protein 184C n=1 Tax=Schistosoma margrebowiei TaxID=48269 RepID=A0A183L9F4_9TREM|nr:unnamed protein product [Schistosoma margrebowiei]